MSLSECGRVLGRRRAGAPQGVAGYLPHRASTQGAELRVYVGQTRSKKLLARLRALGWGECVARGEYPPRRTPWFYDNGAFRDWKSGVSFDHVTFEFEFMRMSRRSPAHPDPDFVILPDVVGDAEATLGLAVYWADRLRMLSWRREDEGDRPMSLALAVQNGMTPSHVVPLMDRISTIFVGGTVAWKWETAASWCALAHRYGKSCHIGRAGTPRLAKLAREVGADSIDSAFPLWSEDHLQKFIAAIESGRISPEAEALERALELDE